MTQFHRASSQLLAGIVLSLVVLTTGTASAQSPADRPALVSPVADDGLPPRRIVRAKGEITFDDLKFDIEKGGEFDRKMLTKEIEALNKKTVRIRGYMLPTFQQSGIEEFVLVRDNMECCFGPGAAIYDCIRVLMEKGKTTSYSTRPVTVRGKFEIEELRVPDGPLLAIYKMTAIEVK